MKQGHLGIPRGGLGLVVAILLGLPGAVPEAAASDAVSERVERALERLRARHGDAAAARLERGVRQAAARWRAEDGDAVDFAAMAEAQFVADPAALDSTFAHLEYAMEQIDGYFLSMNRELRHWMDEDVGPIQPVDRLLAAWDPAAHRDEDLFRARVAFAVLLNFPGSTLEERLRDGASWSRRRWAEVRLVERFESRIPAAAQQAVASATARADAYVSDYNLRLHHVLTADGRRLFPEGLRLISHWGLRDELKSHYGREGGLEKQRLIAKVMERIVEQSIPRAVIDNPEVDWVPETNRVQPAPGSTAAAAADREPDTRYALLLAIFRAMRQVDPWTPETPTAIQRAFDRDKEIPVATVRAMFAGLFEAPEVHRLARFIEQRLGRALEPFDIWYAGFKPRAAFSEAELDAKTRARYPTPAAFEADIPRILADLGFDPATVDFLAACIEVDPSRGAGHAMGAQRRGDKAHLRTRVGPQGMDYKGYNIAIHELGHNVEQVFSLDGIDHTLLAGVPSNAFTEALAFVFQERDLQLLGLETPGAERRHLLALESLWGTCEIGAVALVDIAVWEWMYAHPDADAADLREATVRIAHDVWRRTFGRLMPGTDSPLLGIYSHMLAYPLYLANYPLGHVIALQLERHFERSADLAGEFGRVCRLGRLTPDLWMRRAVGAPLGTEAMLHAAAEALDALGAPVAPGRGANED